VAAADMGDRRAALGGAVRTACELVSLIACEELLGLAVASRGRARHDRAPTSSQALKLTSESV
jgi:hypothetical protein